MVLFGTQSYSKFHHFPFQYFLNFFFEKKNYCTRRLGFCPFVVCGKNFLSRPAIWMRRSGSFCASNLWFHCIGDKAIIRLCPHCETI